MNFGDNKNDANVHILARGLGPEASTRFPGGLRIAPLRGLQVTCQTEVIRRRPAYWMPK